MKILMILLLLFSSSAVAEKTIEISGGAGYTSVDLDSLVEEDEIANTRVTDSEEMNSGFGIQYFFKSMDNFVLGAEYMYQYLYWYQVRVPYPLTREYDVDMSRVGLIARFGSNALVFDVGATLNFLNETAIGAMASANYYLPISDSLDIALKARVDVFDNIVLTIPISLNAGIRMHLD